MGDRVLAVCPVHGERAVKKGRTTCDVLVRSSICRKCGGVNGRHERNTCTGEFEHDEVRCGRTLTFYSH